MWQIEDQAREMSWNVVYLESSKDQYNLDMWTDIINRKVTLCITSKMAIKIWKYEISTDVELTENLADEILKYMTQKIRYFEVSDDQTILGKFLKRLNLDLEISRLLKILKSTEPYN